MPELPEVETTRRGVSPLLTGATVTKLVVRESRLRWPVPGALPRNIRGQQVTAVRRRAKYLIFDMEPGHVLLHLGMSGSLRFVPPGTPPAKHDHIDFELDNDQVLRFTDPRRFGSVLWTTGAAEEHPLLASLGPEPLGAGFSGEHLYAASRGRRVSIKPHIMNNAVVVGVGNIYASESLYRAGIHPRRPAGRIGAKRMDRLAECIREVLTEAIAAGGTTLRDFTVADGTPGYFKQDLRVYDRAGEPCPSCGAGIRQEVLGQRASYFCPRCQR